MKQTFKCPNCGLAVYFEVNLIPGALLSKTVNSISIRDKVASIKLSDKAAEDEVISITTKGKKPMMLSKSEMREVSASLTCDDGHTNEYKVILE